jgi:hypothetical protein
MYVIIRDPVTNANVKVDSLTGFVKGEAVENVSPGVALAEQPQAAATFSTQQASSVRQFVLGPDDTTVI